MDEYLQSNLLGNYSNTTSTSHGAARFLTTAEMTAIGLFDGLGLLFGKHGRTGEYMRYGGDGHALFVAPPGAGKGVGFVIPNLVSYPGSMIVIDPKGENAAQTARHRRDNLGQEVFVLDPSGVSGLPSASYNPLSWLEQSTENDLMADIIEFSKAVVENGFGKESYWADCSQNLFRGLVLYLFGHEPEKLNLVELYRLSRLPLTEFGDLMQLMKVSRCPIQVVQSWLREMGAWFLSQTEDHQKYHLGTLQIATAWMGNIGAQKIMSRSDFSMRDLKREGITVYLCIHPLQIEAYRGWFRLVVSQAVKGVFQPIGRPQVTLKNGNQISPRVVFMLDEYARAVGRLSAVDNAIPQIRGYGGQFAFVLQSVGQMKGLFKDDWTTFEESCGLHCYIQARGETAEHVSKRAGTKTQPIHGGSRSRTSRPLLFPNEISGLPKDDVFTSVEGSFPFCVKRLTSFADPKFSQYLDKNPMERKAIAGGTQVSLFEQVKQASASLPEAPSETLAIDEPRITQQQRNEILRLSGDDW